MLNIFRSNSSRAIFLQLLLLIAIMLFGYYLFSNAASNLERQGIASGFGFLNNKAGFDIIMHLIDYTEQSTYFSVLLVG